MRLVVSPLEVFISKLPDSIFAIFNHVPVKPDSLKKYSIISWLTSKVPVSSELVIYTLLHHRGKYASSVLTSATRHSYVVSALSAGELVLLFEQSSTGRLFRASDKLIHSATYD
jgi:hypothetical protein